MINNRKLQIYYVIAALWAGLSIKFANDFSTALGSQPGRLLVAFIVLVSGPVLPMLWVRKFGRVSWRGQFVRIIVLFGFTGVALLNSYGGYFSYISLGWIIITLLSIWLLNPSGSAPSPQGKAATAPRSYYPIVIDHAKYLTLLDEQAALGFPSVMRARQDIMAQLPKVIPLMAEPNVDQERPDPDQLVIMREYLLGKASTELAFLCAMAFFERVAGLDFRNTSQYQALVNHVVNIPAVASDEMWSSLFNGLENRSVSAKDLSEVVAIIDEYKSKMDNDPALGGVSNVTVCVCAILVVANTKLVLPEQVDALSSPDFTSIFMGAMHDMRHTFSVPDEDDAY